MKVFRRGARGTQHVYAGEWPPGPVPAVLDVCARLDAGPRHGPALLACLEELAALDHPLARSLFLDEAMRVSDSGAGLVDGLARATGREVALRALSDPWIAVGFSDSAAEFVRRLRAAPAPPRMPYRELRLLSLTSEPGDIDLFRAELERDCGPLSDEWRADIAEMLLQVEHDHRGLLASAGLFTPLAAQARRPVGVVDRAPVLQALARCGLAGVELVAEIGALDPDPEVRIEAVAALAGREREGVAYAEELGWAGATTALVDLVEGPPGEPAFRAAHWLIARDVAGHAARVCRLLERAGGLSVAASRAAKSLQPWVEPLARIGVSALADVPRLTRLALDLELDADTACLAAIVLMQRDPAVHAEVAAAVLQRWYPMQLRAVLVMHLRAAEAARNA